MLCCAALCSCGEDAVQCWSGLWWMKALSLHAEHAASVTRTALPVSSARKLSGKQKPGKAKRCTVGTRVAGSQPSDRHRASGRLDTVRATGDRQRESHSVISATAQRSSDPETAPWFHRPGAER